MAIHVTGGLFEGQVANQRQTLERHTVNLQAAGEQLSSIDAVKSATASEDAAMYAAAQAKTAEHTLLAAQEYQLGNHRMAFATDLADTNNYRTIFSPSSAAGPVGPLGATANFVSPYVAGTLHQRTLKMGKRRNKEKIDEYCHVCCVKILTPAAYEKHFSGPRHKREMAKLRGRDVGVGETARFAAACEYVARQANFILAEYASEMAAACEWVDSGKGHNYLTGTCIMPHTLRLLDPDLSLLGEMLSGRSIVFITPTSYKPNTADPRITQTSCVTGVVNTINLGVATKFLTPGVTYRVDVGPPRVPPERMLSVLNHIYNMMTTWYMQQGGDPSAVEANGYIDFKSIDPDLVLTSYNKSVSLGILSPLSSSGHSGAILSTAAAGRPETDASCGLLPVPPEQVYEFGELRVPGFMLNRAYTPPETPEENPVFFKLNDSQKEAVRSVLEAREVLNVIQGPPGTGKTTTAVAIVLEWTRRYKGCKILVTAQSNVGLDNLTEGLAAAGVQCIRVGSGGTDIPGVDNIQDVVGSDEFESTGSRKKDFQLAIEDVDVVCATCIGSGCKPLPKISFPFVLCDEATQALEPATLIALCRGSIQAVLIGDHQQLPPTVTSYEAAQHGYTVPLFTRLVTAGLLTPKLLSMQYRMHPAISAFPNAYFYKGLIQDGVEAAERSLPHAALPNGYPVSFLHCDGCQEGDGTSFKNSAEVAGVLSVVNKVLAAAPWVSVGVISPYGSQVSAIRTALKQSLPPAAMQSIEVKSVDGFQGREKDVILLSLVRTSGVGFIAHPKRINVSLTRARAGLVVLGHLPTLCANDLWKTWLTARTANLLQYTPLAAGCTPLPECLANLLSQ